MMLRLVYSPSGRFVECKHYKYPVVEGGVFKTHQKLRLRVTWNLTGNR